MTIRDATVREATVDDAAGIARVHVESWQTTYKGIMPDDVLAGLSIEQRAQARRDYMLQENWAEKLYVAEDETGEIVGFVIGGAIREPVEMFDGELYAIYALESAQGKGYGRALMTRLIQALRQDGFKSMLLWV
ncbi:MAG TPA: GNAT family N-acetyltransferase, partial [Phototrophicaceae bacterium]|nr:GNAT family N-acetyltransferase [Phototrophicaceae bacterium]